jgi:hypothetical protein
MVEEVTTGGAEAGAAERRAGNFFKNLAAGRHANVAAVRLNLGVFGKPRKILLAAVRQAV